MRRAASAGFTLLEVVLAMTALALISAICYGAFSVGMRAVRAGTCAVTTAQRLRVASDVLTRQIRSVEPFPDGSASFEEPYFRGRSDSVSFVTSAAQLGGGGLALVRYQIEEDHSEPCNKADTGTQRLVMTEVPYFSAYTLDAPDEKRLSRSAVLLSKVEGLSFEYYGGSDEAENRDSGCNGEGWCKRWSTSGNVKEPMDKLPIAIRVTVQRVPGIESEAWVQSTPIAIASYFDQKTEENREANAGLSLENDNHVDDEGGDDEGGDDEADDD